MALKTPIPQEMRLKLILFENIPHFRPFLGPNVGSMDRTRMSLFER
jgi:hypothetical protein